MQSVLSRIWTHVTVSISYDDNHYTPSVMKHWKYGYNQAFKNESNFSIK